MGAARLLELHAPLWPAVALFAFAWLVHQAALVEQVRFLTVRTIYSKIGDVIAYVAMAIIAAGLLVMRRK